MKWSELEFFCEKIDDGLIAEARPLLQAHHDEAIRIQGMRLDPDLASYKALNDAGVLKFYCAREKGVLVGYAAYLVVQHMHFRVLWAHQDLLYLRPQNRRGLAAKSLIEFSERDLTARGVEFIAQYSTKHRNLSPLLSRMGYEEMGSLWGKSLRGKSWAQLQQ